MTTLLILMPTSGHVATPCLKSLISLTQRLRDRMIAFAIETYEFSDIVFSRNYLLSKFLTETHFTHALLLDSDLSFPAETFFRLLGHGADFTVAPYPQRHLPLEKFRALIEAEARNPQSRRSPTGALLAQALKYNLQETYHSGEEWHARQIGDFVTVPGAGTGFMLISRAVPERMVQTGVARALPRHEEQPRHADVRYFDFFSHLTDRAGRLLYAEDQSFCRRWIEGCGGEIWADMTARIAHHGNYAFRGDADVLTGSRPKRADVA